MNKIFLTRALQVQKFSFNMSTADFSIFFHTQRTNRYFFLIACKMYSKPLCVGSWSVLTSAQRTNVC